MSGQVRTPTERGTVILRRLEERSISIAEVERRTPLSKNTISNAIYGPRDPQRKTIEILASVLEIDVEDLTRRGGSEQGSGPHAIQALTFGGWLFRRNNKLLWISVGGSVATAVVLSFGFGQQPTSPLVQGTHFIVIFLLLALLPRPWTAPGETEDASHALMVASRALRDFRRYWGLAWMAWVFLYFTITTSAFFDLFSVNDGVASRPSEGINLLLLNLLQNCGTVLLFMCYEVVAKPTIDDDLRRRQVLSTEAWFAAVALVAFAEGAVVWNGAWASQQWFAWLSGFGQGMALALLVGRFDSKYVNPPAATIALLYLYAVIQGAWPVLRYEDTLMLILTFLALLLKCLLFLFVSWLFESNVILFYLARMRRLDRSVERQRSEFLTRHNRKSRPSSGMP